MCLMARAPVSRAAGLVLRRPPSVGSWEVPASTPGMDGSCGFFWACSSCSQLSPEFPSGLYICGCVEHPPQHRNHHPHVKPSFPDVLNPSVRL